MKPVIVTRFEEKTRIVIHDGDLGGTKINHLALSLEEARHLRNSLAAAINESYEYFWVER